MEKKWFVYLGDHHEGPFSLDEIKEKMTQGVVRTDMYVWAEGMVDWVPMVEVSEFSMLVSPVVEPPSVEMSAPLEVEVAPSESLTLDPPGEEILNEEVPVEEPKTEESLNVESAPQEQDILPQIQLQEIPDDQPSTPPSEVISAAMQAQGVEAESSAGLEKKTPEPESEPTQALTVKEKKQQEKEVKISAKNAQKEKKKAIKIAKRAEKKKKPEMAKVGIKSSSPILKPRVPKRGSRLFILIALMGGMAFGYMEGYFDPFLNSPTVKTELQKLQDKIRPHLLKLRNDVPFLADLISPIPEVSDVSPIDYQELKNAAGFPIDQGPKVAIAASGGDTLSPSFYIATNLPDGARFDLFIKGVPGTLLNRTEFFTSGVIETQSGLGKSEVLKFPDGTPIPRGEYELYVVESEKQSPQAGALIDSYAVHSGQYPDFVRENHKIFKKQTLFLGGKKDNQYLVRLKNYHDSLMKRAQIELNELSQFSSTLISQYNSTVTTFRKLKKGKRTNKKKRTWKKFATRWYQLQDQMIDTFSKWNDETIEKDRFFFSMYKITKEAGFAVKNMHESQAAIVLGLNSEPSDQEVNELATRAEALLRALSARLKDTQSLPRQPGGVPARLRPLSIESVLKDLKKEGI